MQSDLRLKLESLAVRWREKANVILSHSEDEGDDAEGTTLNDCAAEVERLLEETSN